MTIKKGVIKEKLFLFYKIFFSLLIIPVVGIIVHDALNTQKEKYIWHQESYFRDEAEFLEKSQNSLIDDYLKSANTEKIKYIQWSPIMKLRKNTYIVRVKYSIKDKSGGLSINDKAFIIEDGEVKKSVTLDL